MVALPTLVEVKTVISSKIPGIFGRQSQQDLLIDDLPQHEEREALRMTSRFLMRVPR